MKKCVIVKMAAKSTRLCAFNLRWYGDVLEFLINNVSHSCNLYNCIVACMSGVNVTIPIKAYNLLKECEVWCVFFCQDLLYITYIYIYCWKVNMQ
jgi:hypothetical protein